MQSFLFAMAILAVLIFIDWQHSAMKQVERARIKASYDKPRRTADR